MLNQYDKEKGCLSGTDINILVSLEEPGILIFHRSKEFNTAGHIHCRKVAEGGEGACNLLSGKINMEIRGSCIRG